MKVGSPKIKRQIVALGAVALAVGVLVWLYDNHLAQGKKIPADALVVDVRTPGEYAGGHYHGAINIPLSQLRSRMSELGPKNRHIIVYCRSGSRSAVARRILVRAGFSKVEDGGSLSRMRRRKRARRAPGPQPTEKSR